MAIRTGKFLRFKAKQLGFTADQILVKTSPFLRCIMTAIGICKGLEITPKLKIDSSISEFLSGGIFEAGDPMDKLVVRDKGDLNRLSGFEVPDDLELDYSQDKYEEQIKLAYPETEDDCLLRTLAAHIMSTAELDSIEKNEGRSVFMINVSHLMNVMNAADLNILYSDKDSQFLELAYHFKS